MDKEPFEAYIAEQVDSNVDGGSLKFDWYGAEKHRFNLYAAAQLTKRKSYYGGGEPIGTLPENPTPEELETYNQRLASYGQTRDLTYTFGGQYAYDFNRLLFMPSTITAGVEYTADDLSDQSGYREEAIKQEVNTKSVYAQNEWKDERWSFLVGARLDKHSLLKNAIISPRANIRFNPADEINLRLSYGQGFRAPQLFDEDLHVNIADGESIVSVLDSNLKKETSHSFSASVDWYFNVDNIQFNFLAEGFYTRLLDPFTSVMEEQADGSWIYRTVNSSGAKVYGGNFEIRSIPAKWLELQIGATVQKSLYDEAIKWSDDENDLVTPTKRMMRTPDMYGYFIATLTPLKRFTSVFSGNYTGSMLVPHEAGYIEVNRTEETLSFFELNWKASYIFSLYQGSSFELSAGIQNIFNAYQKDFDKGADRASSYIYGPTLPRSYFVGGKITF